MAETQREPEKPYKQRGRNAKTKSREAKKKTSTYLLSIRTGLYRLLDRQFLNQRTDFAHGTSGDIGDDIDGTGDLYSAIVEGVIRMGAEKGSGMGVAV